MYGPFRAIRHTDVRSQIHARLQRAQKLLKQSRQKDYYKVLGVSRDADTKTIKKALYVTIPPLRQAVSDSRRSRKAAMTAHPDKGGSEAKMAAVNEAYEVLSNPGMSLLDLSTYVLY